MHRSWALATMNWFVPLLALVVSTLSAQGRPVFQWRLDRAHLRGGTFIKVED